MKQRELSGRSWRPPGGAAPAGRMRFRPKAHPVHSVENSLHTRIGGTPLLELARFRQQLGLDAHLLAKLEGYNPSGSLKDRMVRVLVEDAEHRGQLRPGSTIIEHSSGNTGISLASICVPMGYRVVLTMPNFILPARRRLLEAYGAELVLTQAELGVRGALDKARELVAQIPGSYLPDQFANPMGPVAHKHSTGPEIWAATGGRVDFLVAGIGTGATITGTGEYLREQNSRVRVIGVEPAASPVLSGGPPGPHGIAGIGAGFVPPALNTGLLDDVFTVTEEEARQAVRQLSRTEGVLAGLSSGAALAAAARLSANPRHRDKTIVVILPDKGHCLPGERKE